MSRAKGISTRLAGWAVMVAVSFFTIHSALAAATVRLDGKQSATGRWIKEKFAKGAVPPFSFVYGGAHSDGFIRKWNYSARSMGQTVPGAEQYVYTWSDPSTGLTVECTVTGYNDHNAVEWVLTFTNNGSGDTPTLTDVKVSDISFTYGPAGDPTVHYADGSHVSKADFHPRSRTLAPGENLYMSPRGGRSSDTAFPFFNIATPAGGVVTAIGWTGTWYADISHTSPKAVSLASGMKDMELYLHAGETIRTPSVCLLFWQGADRMAGHNRFRRFVMEHQTRRIDGRPARYPVSTGFNFGDPSPCNEYSCLTEDYAIAMIRRYEQFGILPEVFWLDAGWYTGANDHLGHKNWANTVGTWTVDQERFPRGLAPVADEVHDKGLQFMVWFEPERVMKGSDWAVRHPEWMLDAGGDAYLMDLGNQEACAWVCDQIGDFIQREGIDHYRQDFNMEPAVFWEANDEPGRKGMREIRHIEGLYRFWDYLLERFPNLLIDNCASGGRRLDLETTKRSAPLWRTDYSYGEPIGYQCHTYGLSFYLPLHGTGTLKTDRFTFRSSLGTSVIYNWKITDPSFSYTEMQRCLAEFHDIRPYYYEDFYPLTANADNTTDQVWLAYQLHRPSDDTGVVLAFRRDDSPESERLFTLSALDPDADYAFLDVDTGQETILTAAELAAGLRVNITQTRETALLKYRKL